MKKVAFTKCALLSLFVLISIVTDAQQTFRTTTSGSIIGYLEYLPQDYNNNSDKYPVLIFLHGVDERGATSTDPAVLQTTISRVAKLGPPMHVKNGTQFPFILITPQLKDSYGSWPSSYVKEVIDHVKTYLRIDERRIHITGLSMGGHGTWTCTENMPSVFASSAPVCGANNSPSKACGIASENVAVWAFHGDADPVVSYTKTTNMVNAINACSPAPTPLAKATLYSKVQHNAWYRAYFLDNTYHNPNFYQWIMLQKKSKRGGNVIPTANAGADKTLVLPTNSLAFNGAGSDTDGTINSYVWSQITGPSTATLSGATTANLTASNLTIGTYVFKLQVTDNGGLIDSDFVSVTVSSTGSNTPPVVSVGADKKIDLPTSSTTLAGTASDSDGTIAIYNWTQISGATTTLTGATTNTLSVSGLTSGSYTFRLTVTDDKGATSFDDVVVSVNNPPTVSAGADMTITLPTNTVSIQGTASDTDGTIASYAWTMTTGTTATLSGTSTSKLTASGLVEGSYVFRLTVKDNSGTSKFDDVKVTVLASTARSNAPPVASAGSDQLISLPANSISLTGTGTDSDGTIAGYSWTKYSGGTATLSGTSTNVLTASGLVAGSYVFRLTVTDNVGATSFDDVTVVVNAQPTVSAGPDITITLPTNSVTVQGTASDPDGTISSYSWKMTTGTTVPTLTGATTSKLTAAELVEGSYVFRLTVTDNNGATKFDDVKVVVNPNPNPNIAPVAFAGNDTLFSLPTNSVTVRGSGTDSDGTIASYSWSKISGGAATLSGTNTNILSASGLVAGPYVFRLTVTDNAGASHSDDVTITVNNPPTVSVGADFSITLPTNTVSVQGTASDSDGTIVSYLWKMTTGTVGTLSGTTTSKLTASGLVEGAYVFRLIVKDNNGATKFDDVKITVYPDPSPNTLPVADAGPDQLISLPTDSVTLTGSGSDTDGSISSYSWTKVSGGAAMLTNAGTNQVTATGLEGGTYLFRLTVTDNRGGSHSDDVTVTVNIPPSVSVGADYKITLPTNYTSIQGAVSDVDGTIVSYQWKMTTGTVATLSGTNTSRLTAEGLVEGPYVFRLIVKDNHGASKFDDVKIWVLPDPNTPNTLPVANAGPDQLISLPTDSISLAGSGSDADGSVASYSWAKISGGTATLANATTAALTASDLQGGVYVFRLTVTDNRGGKHSDDVTVTVNIPPTVSVGADFKLTLPNNSLSVQGIASDPDGTIVSYQWKMTTGTIATLSGINTLKLTATDLVEGPYVFRLIVKDNLGASKFDDVKIVVYPAPTSGSSTQAVIVVEDPNQDNEARELSYDNENYWKDKKVVIYDESGKQMFSGRWSAMEFVKVLNPGKLYIYNIHADGGKRLKQGKVFVNQ